MVLFGTEPVVLFRNETGRRRFRRNVWKGVGKGEGEEGEKGRGEKGRRGGGEEGRRREWKGGGLDSGGRGRVRGLSSPEEEPSAQAMTRIK